MLRKKNPLKAIYLLICLAFVFTSNAQPYPPAAGNPGSTALHKDSTIFINWAHSCSIERGYRDISVPDSGYATVGDSTMATGMALSNGVVSLGDGGHATCTFPLPISNGPGFDFAVFENSFSDTYLELAFVEVSSDGEHFFRFPSHSLTDTTIQVGPFDTLNPKNLHNLAGKYRASYGTPFDLDDLPFDALLDKNAIQFVRIVDCIGSITDEFASFDNNGNKINDPWPTTFPSSGFDLDAIGVIHQNVWYGVPETNPFQYLGLYPNPAGMHQEIKMNIPTDEILEEVSVFDHLQRKIEFKTQPVLHLDQCGTYFIFVQTNKNKYYSKLIIF